MQDRAYRKIINSWAMYDWANSAFMTTVVSGMFGPFYRSMAMSTGLDKGTASAYFAYTTAIALLSVALLAPVLGATSDHTGGKKKFLGAFMALGVVATALMVFLGPTSYLRGSVLFILADVGIAGSLIFYEALLPHIAKKGDIDQVSTRGYAFGYLGGGLLLLINILWVTRPDWFFMPGKGFAVRASFFSVAVWCALFSIPLFRNVPEPPVVRVAGKRANPIRAGFARLLQTFRRIKQYKQLLLFLVAFWLYNDGVASVYKLATTYGDEMKIPVEHMLAALLITQFVGIPCAFGFGWLAGRVGAKRMTLLGIGVYVPITVAGYFMYGVSSQGMRTFFFYLLAFAVGLVQGGTQALSRSLYGVMVPKSRSTEFFGFFSTSSKFAGLIGPALFGVISQAKGSSQLSILSLIVLFIVGGVLLAFVNVEEGVRVARSEDAAAVGQDGAAAVGGGS